jgi:formylglycine-generating enzyme required for sulfatase activity
MRTFAMWSIVLLATAGTANSETENRPKELTVDVGGGVKLEMVLIPAGEFMMGTPNSDQDTLADEQPQHRVRITKPFYLGKYLVTQEQWQAVMGSNRSYFKGPKNPVESVSWENCQVFLKRLRDQVGGGEFQLPTEAQWEYTCRAGSTTKYYFGDKQSELGEYAWYRQNSHGNTHPVGEKKPNAWGLYDMYGNVWEWCADRYSDGYYAHSPTDDPTGPSEGTGRAIRGASWDAPASRPRSARRAVFGPNRWDYVLGLRVSFVPTDK